MKTTKHHHNSDSPLQPDPWTFYYREQELAALASHRQSPEDNGKMEKRERETLDFAEAQSNIAMLSCFD